MVGPARIHVDAWICLAPRWSRHFVDDALAHPDLHSAERVHEVAEPVQVDHRVVVHAQAEQARNRLLERSRAGISPAGKKVGTLLVREAVERVEEVGEAAQLFSRAPAEPNVDEVARNTERDRAAGVALQPGEDHRVGAVASPAGALVASDQQDRYPRPLERRVGLNENVARRGEPPGRKRR